MAININNEIKLNANVIKSIAEDHPDIEDLIEALGAAANIFEELGLKEIAKNLDTIINKA